AGGVLISAAMRLASVGVMLLTVVAAWLVPDWTRLWLLFAPPPPLVKLPMLPLPLVTVPLALCACEPALLSADDPFMPMSALPLWLCWPWLFSSVVLFLICVPIAHTLTAPPTPTAPKAPLMSRPLMLLMPTASTSMLSFASTVAPEATWAVMLLLSVPTSTAPETPTKP